MKKSLAALAVLSAFGASAMAADVTLYGIIDEGLLYTHIDGDRSNVDATDNLELKSGIQSGSRFGLKGMEELGNGWSVGFILENGFNADDGTFKTSNTLFDRESSLSLYGPFGQLSVGRIGALTQGTSSWAKLGMISAFGTSFSDYAAQAGVSFAKSKVWDNMVAYQTPNFAGFKVYAQYAMGSNDEENTSGSDRYYAIGATYQNGPAAALLVVDSTNYKSTDNYGVDDSLTVTFGGSWDFEVAKLFAGVQYFDEVKLSSVGTMGGLYDETGIDDLDKNADGKNRKLEGYAVSVSASAPLVGGTGMFGVSYIDAEQADSEKTYDFDVSRWVVSAGYTYPFSKRTNVYGVVSYVQDSYDVKQLDRDYDPSAIAAMIGLRHSF